MSDERCPVEVTSCACTFHGHSFGVSKHFFHIMWGLPHVAGAAGARLPFTKQKPKMPTEFSLALAQLTSFVCFVRLHFYDNARA